MTAMGLLLIIILGLCVVGILLPLAVDERLTPAIVGWLGACAAAVLLCFSGASLFADVPFHSTLWSIPSLATLTLSLDRLSALFLFVSGLILLPGSIFAAGNLRRYAARTVSGPLAFHISRSSQRWC